MRSCVFLGIGIAFVSACGGTASPSTPPTVVSPVPSGETTVMSTEAPALSPSASPAARAETGGGVLEPKRAECSPAKWTSRSLPPLLKAGKKPKPNSKHADHVAYAGPRVESSCADHPDGPPGGAGVAVTIDGVNVHVNDATPAGKSGRGWPGNQCTFVLAQSGEDTSPPVKLGSDVVPPFNGLTSLARSGSAVWVELSFNGYTKEFPRGGNRVVALDLCEGRVVWKSNDGISNGGLLLVGDYLIAAFGFTGEARYVHVLDAYTGKLVQKLPVLENICPSKAWAPNWSGGRCDAPGQLVGAATNPRIEGGLFLVDTNTGSAAFELE